MNFKFLKLIFVISICFFLSNNIFAQNNQIVTSKFQNLLIKNKNYPQHSKSKHKGILGFYKNYISSQDYGSCPYSPSCSVYTFSSIKKYGILIGIIQGFDRLSRCNNNQIDHYEHTQNHKLIDLP